MEFNTDVFALDKPSSVKFNLCDIKITVSRDLYFRAKQEELLNQYKVARIFMYETDTSDWEHWFNPSEDEVATKAFHLMFRAMFYETALFYYNAVVDISWAMCYLSAEYACNQNGVRVDFGGMKPIEEAAALLRSAERNVTSPTAETNPFEYLKKMCPEFIPAIDQIIDFWNGFADAEIRKNYNYCKHKGKPKYKEIKELEPGKTMSIFIENKEKGTTEQMASDISDVQYMVSLEQAISQLRDFDDNVLYPYIETLIQTLEDIIEPSPMAF